MENGYRSKHNKKEEVVIPALVYMDDTTWLVGSREKMQKTLDTATNFFKLNDIEVNSDKTKVLVIRKGKYKEESLNLGGQKINSIRPEEKVRILGPFWMVKGPRDIKEIE